MGITQHHKAVDTIKEIVNLLLLRGNIGQPGAGASPIRGHSNVQGDRTMGIWEQMPESSWMHSRPNSVSIRLANTVSTRYRRSKHWPRNEIKVWLGLGGNLVAAISDTASCRSSNARDRPDRAGLDEAEPLARRDRG